MPVDKSFIEYVAKSIVDFPNAVRVERRVDEKGVLLQLIVHPDDLGRIIGKEGSTAKAMRSMLHTLGVKNNARYNLQIIDTGGGNAR